MPLPDFIIIGAMKAGTTSLYNYLDSHPGISMSKKKEIDFFSLDSNYKKGVDWYRDKFNSEDKIKGEASTSYTKYPQFKGVPERINKVVPEVKLIYVLRDPIERIKSHFVHNLCAGYESRSVEEAFKILSNNHYVLCSQYYLQLSRFTKKFDYSQILILESEKLRNRTRDELLRTLKFLGLEERVEDIDFNKNYHVSEEKGKRNQKIQNLLKTSIGSKLKNKLPENLKSFIKSKVESSFNPPDFPNTVEEKLKDYLRKDVVKLREVTQIKFKHWSI